MSILEIFKFKKYLGVLKFYQNRINGYLSVINATNIILILSNLYDTSFYYIALIIIVLVVAIAVFDKKLVNAVEIDYWLNRSESFKKLCNDVDFIKEELKNK